MERVVGIDIAEARLDAFCLATGRRHAVSNDPNGIAELAAWLAPESLVVMEASGGYERLAHRLLAERGLQAAIVNPARVRHFAKAAGLLARPTGSMPWRSPATAPSPGRRRCRRGHGRPWPPCSAARPGSARC